MESGTSNRTRSGFRERRITSSSSETELLSKLETVRKCNYGTFIMNHAGRSSSLYVHMNGKLTYPHYLPHDRLPGYQTIDMPPEECDQDVHFLHTDEQEANGFDMQPSATFSLITALTASAEFFKSTELPSSVSWFEL